ncbi:uncharacterized protein LOC126820737 [Patella vulgata]|uniref:uncharacterized protein LOC126820737 n=1 Tax=Patella vulgata TaxID=6465 RepID=UPI00217F2C5A|nr:uncharacterized protein LOC126820737 [Patella vulgata]XP_055957401.1 uncharacterized protein LOC126820737 [Patella vulgata]
MAESSGLKSLNKIVLPTRQGNCAVEFMCGDITKLPMEDKVDIVMVSAFPNDYSLGGKHTLISALYHNLDLCVATLSRKKDVDLRRNFSCWVSCPLPDHLPYRRLVCFERIAHAGSIGEQISKIYRAFTPVFNNQDTTVITPLLATGNQGQPSRAVLEMMVNGACSWILAGLPLRHMKIVIYSKNVNEIYKRDAETVELFNKLKLKWEKIGKQKASFNVDITKYDIYMSFSPNDQMLTNKVIKKLKQIQPKIKLYTDMIAFEKDDVWQEKIYEAMIKSKRIIVILSPAYIASEECLEQFNMALCCNRLKRKQIVAPFYIETIPTLPSYILLVQYVECRIRRETDNLDTMIQTACVKVQESLKEEKMEDVKNIHFTPKYDVFISYAHRSSKDAVLLLNLLQSKSPELSIFFDKSELTTGSVWQKSLYEAIDNSDIVIAMISEAYIKSTVCREEYNIALARHLSQYDIHFIPVCCDDLTTVPVEFSHVPMLDNREKDDDEVIQNIADTIVYFKSTGIRTSILKQKCAKEDINIKMEKEREKKFHQYYKVKKDQVEIKMKNLPVKQNLQVAFSFSQNCLKYAVAVQQFLETFEPSTKCMFLSGTDNERLTILDKADRIVILVSQEYIKSTLLMEEFHIAMCRQRTIPNSVLYFINTAALEPKPTFMSIIPYSISRADKLWKTLTKGADENRQLRLGKEGFEGSYSFAPSDILAMKTAAVDLLHGLPEGEEWVNIISVMTDTDKPNKIPIKQCIRIDKGKTVEVDPVTDVVALTDVVANTFKLPENTEIKTAPYKIDQIKTAASETRCSKEEKSERGPVKAASNETRHSQAESSEIGPIKNGSNETVQIKTEASESRRGKVESNESGPIQLSSNETRRSKAESNETRPIKTTSNETGGSKAKVSETGMIKNDSNTSKQVETVSKQLSESQQNKSASRSCILL